MQRETRAVDLNVSRHRLLPLLSVGGTFLVGPHSLLGLRPVQVVEGVSKFFRGRTDVSPGIDPATENRNEFGEKSTIHVSAHLVQHEPVSK